jgi:hypothetical protein
LLHWLEDLFDRIPGSYLRHALGKPAGGVRRAVGAASTKVTLRELARRDFTVASENSARFGVITREHISESVANNIGP